MKIKFDIPYEESANDIDVFISDYKIFYVSGKTLSRRPLNFFLPESFKRNPLKNDIGIIELNQPVQFNSYVRAGILIYHNYEVADDTNVTQYGYGGKELTGSSTEYILQTLNAKTVNRNECRRAFASGKITNKMICARRELYTDLQLIHPIEIHPTENDTRPLCTCGIDNSTEDARIIGGQDAERGKHPYAVALYKTYLMDNRRTTIIRTFCGGTLITERHVMTAGHCIEGESVNNFEVFISDYKISYIRGTTLSRRPLNFFLPQSYESDPLKNDIGIIELNEPVPLNSYIRAGVLIYQNYEVADDINVTVYGFGSQILTVDATEYTLQTLNVKTVNRNVCRRLFPTNITITNKMICAGGVLYEDMRPGDSGNGLVLRMGNEDVHIGVVSMVRTQSGGQEPEIYTKLSHFIPFVRRKTLNATCQPCIISSC